MNERSNRAANGFDLWLEPFDRPMVRPAYTGERPNRRRRLASLVGYASSSRPASALRQPPTGPAPGAR